MLKLENKNPTMSQKNKVAQFFFWFTGYMWLSNNGTIIIIIGYCYSYLISFYGGKSGHILQKKSQRNTTFCDNTTVKFLWCLTAQQIQQQ